MLDQFKFSCEGNTYNIVIEDLPCVVALLSVLFIRSGGHVAVHVGLVVEGVKESMENLESIQLVVVVLVMQPDTATHSHQPTLNFGGKGKLNKIKIVSDP